jgi:hypothetical protein
MLPKDTFPIYHIPYGTPICSVNEAIVAAESPENAKSILEDYLLHHPLNSRFPNSSIPDDGLKCRELEFRATTPGVIYCSLDSLRE